MRLFYRFIFSCITLILLITSSLNAQAYNNERGGASIPSAAAMSYGKYADIPVNQYTGTGNIAVPLFSVSDGPISLGIGLQYHTAGIPVGTPSGAVGLGWNLNYGGMVSRTIRGVADDDPDGYYYKGSFVNTNMASQVADGTRDSEPDLYTYTAGGYSGKFTFASDQSIKMIPESDVQITVDAVTDFQRFTIITPDGTIYRYGLSADGTRSAYDYTTNVSLFFSNDRSGWHLIEVESHDKKHKIDLFYEYIGYAYSTIGSCLGVTKYRKSNGNIDTKDDCTNLIQEIKVVSVLPTRIETPLQTIDFFSSLSRSDLDDYNSFYKSRKIFKVEMTDGPNCVGYDFTQSYFYSSHLTNAEKRLKLDAVNKYSCVTGSTLDEPDWTFDYIGTDLGNGKQFFPAYDDLNIDHWGYYNYDASEGNNTGDLTPPSSFYLGNSYINYGSANRKSKESAMLNGILQKVTYPTGGSLQIEYEANQYFEPGINQIYTNLIACQTSNCGGYKSETSSPITFTQDMIDNGSWDLCLIAFDDSGPNNGYDPDNNLARVEVFNSSNTLIQTREFNSTTDFCQIGTFPFISIGPAIQAGQSYTFKVTSYNANATFTVRAPGNGSNQIAGGLRIKQTKVHDRVNTANDIITDYSYLQVESTNSSGKLFRKPNYAYQLNSHTVLFTSYSESPLTSFGGSHIGYSKVVTSQAGNGRTEMVFEAEDDQANVHLQYPVPPAKYKAEAGVMSESAVEKENGAIIATTTTTRYSGDTYEIIGNASGNGIMFSARNVKTYSGNGNSLDDEVAFTTYQLRTSIYRPDIVTTTKDGISVSTNYNYHPNNLLPDEVVMTNSNGDTYENQTKYVTDYVTPSLRNEFAARNIKYLPYRTYSYQNGDYLDGTRNYYRFFDQNGNNPSSSNGANTHPRPYIVQRYARTFNAAGTLQSGSFVEQMRFTDYSDDGLVASYEEPNWDPVTITFNGKLPASKSFLGHTTQYVYETNGSKLKSIIAVDGTQTDYEYDDLMRLESIEDVCKGITTTYSYNLDNGPGFNNYTSVLTDYPTDPTNRSDVDDVEVISYKDGLGRDLQTIARQLGPNTNQDVITAVSYDNRGRPFKSYEPKTFTNNNGAYQNPATSWDHTLTTYEDSPLSRTLTVTPPDWHPSTFSYGKNTSSDAVKIDGGSSTYATGKLVKQTVEDANGNKLITFTDKIGRKILSRRTDNADQTSKRLDTYYLYDGKGRVTKIIPPGASAGSSELVYTYLYDGEDRIIEKKIPGKDKTEYRYNNRDLLAAERDGYLRNEGDWYVHSYDVFGREKESGFYNSTPPTTITDLVPTDPLLKTFYGTGHEKDKVKTVETKILDGSSNWLTTTNTYSTCGLLTQQTGNNHLRLTISSPESTTYTYDGADNLVGSTYTHKVPNATHTIASKHYYDHAGRSEKNYFKVDNGTDRQLNEFVYDGKGQVVTKYQGATGLSGTRSFLQKIDYGYLANGMLEGINLNGLTGGQVSLPSNGSVGATVNPGSPSTSSYDDKDLFYLQLYRDDPANVSGPGPAPARYNGDISFVASQVRGRRQQLFGVKYDTYDRMTEAKFYERVSSSSTGYRVDAYSETPTYDKRGNIQTLTRKGLSTSGSIYNHGTIDDLDYDYEQTNGADNNRLKEISDGGSATEGYQSNTGQYAYDDNGNTTYDPSRGITIAYNHLDLPVQIIWDDGRKLVMTYDASGTLLTRETYPAGTSTPSARRHFIGGIEYSGATTNPTLEVIHHDEGRIQFTGTSQEWQYSLTDHLGNTRLLYADLNNDGIPAVPSEIIQEEHYYPFGMKMTGPWMGATAGAKTAYQYNGIEYVDDFDLNVNMAMYRTLDPTTGRWWSVDPMAELMLERSPYSSMMNSPFVYNDPDGDIAPFFAAALIGGFVNVASQGLQGEINSIGDFAGSFLVGAFAGGVGAGVTSGISASLAGGSFGAGFIGSSGVASTGFFAGGLSGAAGGLAGNFSLGFGNGLLNGEGGREALNKGISDGISGAVSGGLLGGISGGIQSRKMGLNFFSGKTNIEVFSAGADGLLTSKKLSIGFKGFFELVPVFESPGLGNGGIALPGFGIIVGPGSFSKSLNPDVLKHEFGHILQSRLIGPINFYAKVGVHSLASASFGSNHRSFWTETWANYLSQGYFASKGIPWKSSTFPAKNLSWWMHIWVRSPI